MIGGLITEKDGAPMVDGKKLSKSLYQPSKDVMDLFMRVQSDYGVNWRLQHRTMDEFDGLSLLQRTREDQRTFGAFVGAEYLPVHKRWRWRGRKNTARNRLIGILAHMLASMLFPYVYAQNDYDEEDKMTARVMRILIEDHLKKARYEVKFLFMVLSALVNPAVFVHVEYVMAFQRVKKQLSDGTVDIVEAIDELMSGIGMHIIPIDEMLLGDFFSGTGQVQRQPNIIRVRRIGWDEARKIYGQNPNFKYVEAGKTRVVMATQERATLFDIEWTEADRNYVQEITAYYRSEDLEVCFVAGVFMGDETDIYKKNGFRHRRMSLIGNEWISIPVYPYAMSGFEPIDPSGRFAYYKSGAFKAYWEDKGINRAHQLMFDGMQLDVLKPMFLSGIANVDSTVIAPGATIGMPQGATATLYSLSPNIAAAFQVLTEEKQDLNESTQDQTQSGIQQPNVTARAVMIAQQNARVFLGVFGVMVADLVKQVGELTADCILQHTTVGEFDATIPEALRMKYKTLLAKSKGQGKELTNKIVFTDRHMGQSYTAEDIRALEWELFDKAGGYESDQRIYEVNPYKFARTRFSYGIDADEIVSAATGTKDQKDQLAFAMMTDPRVAPFTDQKSVIDDFVIDKYGGTDPDKYKAKGNPNDLLSQMGMMSGHPQPGQRPSVQAPQPLSV